MATLTLREQVVQHAGSVKGVWDTQSYWADRATLILILLASSLAPSVVGYTLIMMALGAY